MNNNTAGQAGNPYENTFESVLDEIVRKGAHEMLKTAFELEINSFCDKHKDKVDQNGHRLVTRNGFNSPRNSRPVVIRKGLKN